MPKVSIFCHVGGGGVCHVGGGGVGAVCVCASCYDMIDADYGCDEDVNAGWLQCYSSYA